MGAKHIDHIAFRVEDLEKAVKFYTEVMGFKVTDRFFIDFEDNTNARCAALQATATLCTTSLTRQTTSRPRWPR